mmetsp:Transcript_13875/g.16764  ORF Transcript_13875/g.16764 Transcript_13875/m.16764 type:complete len:131 (-) Transcript_13875:1448-1840(-)
MRDDVLAQRLFYGGCLGLPWLWLVHVMYWYGKQRQNSQDGEASNSEALLSNADTNDDDETQGSNSNDGASALSDEEIKMEAQKWVQRSKYGSTVVFGLWAGWIVFFQLSKDKFGPNWFVRTEDEGEFTGW